MLKKQSIKIGKLLKKAMRLRGGGSALPGLVVETLAPEFLATTLAQLPKGVVVVSGTNGKTTTTKIVTELLRAHHLRVFTNPSGSNFTRGVVASLLDHVDDEGTLDFDIAVVELDEAHAVRFVESIPPRFSLILNVFRDQLDRFGEIDATAKLLAKVIDKTTNGIVLNRDDELVRGLAHTVERHKRVQYFGVSPSLRKLFPSDATMRDAKKTASEDHLPPLSTNDVLLSRMTAPKATFAFGKKPQKAVELKLSGVYNLQNAAAALALCRMILEDDFDKQLAFDVLSKVRPAFGRGEAFEIDGNPVEIVLVKNPSGFRLSLSSYAEKPAQTMIAINDNFADGRDMSWLWDVNFKSLQEAGVAYVSGIRAYDMALRLHYDEVSIGKIILDPAEAVLAFVATPGPKRIFCSYTAMLALRRELAKHYPLEAIE